MELKYLPLFIIGIIVVLIYVIFIYIKKKKSKEYKDGIKIANTSLIKNTSYFKKKMFKYKSRIYFLRGLALISLILVVVLMSRPIKISSKLEAENNRDIYLCMDVSASVDELNLELVKDIKSTVESLKGERIGISIFNTSSVVLVPLTDDYDYVLEILDKIEDSLYYNVNLEQIYFSGMSTEEMYDTVYYIRSGTIEGNEERGSSLIGDGLASCVFSFSNLDKDKDRTRITIFSTDNALEGTPWVTTLEAGALAKRKNVLVYGIGTSNILPNDEKDLKESVESTGGKYYNQKDYKVGSIIKDINSTSKTVYKKDTVVTITDIPKYFFITLFVILCVLFVVSKVVM